MANRSKAVETAIENYKALSPTMEDVARSRMRSFVAKHELPVEAYVIYLEDAGEKEETVISEIGLITAEHTTIDVVK